MEACMRTRNRFLQSAANWFPLQLLALMTNEKSDPIRGPSHQVPSEQACCFDDKTRPSNCTTSETSLYDRFQQKAERHPQLASRQSHLRFPLRSSLPPLSPDQRPTRTWSITFKDDRLARVGISLTTLSLSNNYSTQFNIHDNQSPVNKGAVLSFNIFPQADLSLLELAPPSSGIISFLNN